MTNYDKLKTRDDETLEEMAIKMLVSRIAYDVEKRCFHTFVVHGYYFPLYKSMKDWLNSEVEE